MHHLRERFLDSSGCVFYGTSRCSVVSRTGSGSGSGDLVHVCWRVRNNEAGHACFLPDRYLTDGPNSLRNSGAWKKRPNVYGSFAGVSPERPSRMYISVYIRGNDAQCSRRCGVDLAGVCDGLTVFGFDALSKAPICLIQCLYIQRKILTVIPTPHVSLPSTQLVQFTHLLAFSLIYFLQNLHLTCFFTILSSVPLEYASAKAHSASAIQINLTTLSKKLPYANTTAPSSRACLTVL
jgi:hypothetical protein